MSKALYKAALAAKTLQLEVSSLFFPYILPMKRERRYKVYTEARMTVIELMVVALGNRTTDERLSALGKIRSIAKAFGAYDNAVRDSLCEHVVGSQKEKDRAVRAAEQKLRREIAKPV